MKVCIIGSYAKALVMTSGRIPSPGETLIGQDYRETFGGKGSDMAVQAARLGTNVGYIGVVGDDPFGHEFIDLMKEEGVKTEGIRVTGDKPTGVGFIVKDRMGANIIIVDMGANGIFCEKDIDQNMSLIQEADVVLAQLEIPMETALYALKRAKEMGKLTILNPAPACDLREQELSFVDIITPNETEARVVIGELPDVAMSHREVADELLRTGCKKVVMTLGGEGAGIFTSDESVMVGTFSVDVVDSNGAGDCFNASLASALSGGRGLEEAVAYANAVAALCCTKWETVPSYHRAEEVETFLASQNN